MGYSSDMSAIQQQRYAQKLSELYWHNRIVDEQLKHELKFGWITYQQYEQIMAGGYKAPTYDSDYLNS